MRAGRKKAESTGVEPKARCYFAWLYVAGMMGDGGWAVYFPKRDIGFNCVGCFEESLGQGHLLHTFL